MNLVSIQGAKASGLQFTDDHLAIAHQLMNALSAMNYLIISSKHRTDILYQSQHEKNETIIRLWCLYMNKDHETHKKLFFQAKGRYDSIQYFFSRLLFLRRMPIWHREYMISLSRVLGQSDNKIACIIRDCSNMLSAAHILNQVEEVDETDQKAPTQNEIQSIVIQTLAKYNLN